MTLVILYTMWANCQNPVEAPYAVGGGVTATPGSCYARRSWVGSHGTPHWRGGLARSLGWQSRHPPLAWGACARLLVWQSRHPPLAWGACARLLGWLSRHPPLAWGACTKPGLAVTAPPTGVGGLHEWGACTSGGLARGETCTGLALCGRIRPQKWTTVEG